MGFTPTGGVVMGTRCGDIDPAIIPYMIQQKKLSAKEMDTILTKQS
jgi:acetate kinase